MATQQEKLQALAKAGLQITDPKFLKEYDGVYLGFGQDIYQVSSNGVTFLGTAGDSNFKYTSDIAKNTYTFDANGGLQPRGKSSFQQSEAYRYVDKSSTAYKKAEAEGFGMGRQPDISEYTGQVSNLNGTKVYMLTDGSWNSKPPTQPITEEQVPISYQWTGNKEDATNPNVSIAGSQTNPTDTYRAEFKGSDGISPAVFVGTQAEIEAQARAKGINPANLFYNGSQTPGQPPASNSGSSGGGTGSGNNGTVLPEDVMQGNDISTLDWSSLPESLRNDPTFKSLSDENKQVVAATYLANTALSDADKGQWLSALEQAKNLVEPFYAQQIVIAQDEILRGFTDTAAANKMRLDLIQTNIERINEDLATGTDRLSIDQQAQLAKVKRGYENNLVDLQNQISDSGMAFNSRAGDLLSRAAIENKDVQTSTNRSFYRQMQDLNTQAQRGLQDQQSQKDALALQQKADFTAMTREAEKLLGTSGLTDITSKLDQSLQDILGNIGTLGIDKGTLEQQKTGDILATAGSLYNTGNLNL